MRYFLLPITILLLFSLPQFALQGIILSFIWFFDNVNFLIYFFLIEFFIFGVLAVCTILPSFIFIKISLFYKKSRNIFFTHSFFWIFGSIYYYFLLERENMLWPLDVRMWWVQDWIKTLIGYPQFFSLIIATTLVPIFIFLSTEDEIWDEKRFINKKNSEL